MCHSFVSHCPGIEFKFSFVFLFFIFQPRRWPELTLKSPGIKPRRHNQASISMPGTLPFSTKTLQTNNNNNMNNINNNNSINNSNTGSHINNNYNTSEGEQSPPGNTSSTSSAHEFSVFANVNIQGSSVSLFSQSQMNLSSIAASVADFSETISLSSAMMAPELPKRSNSIISLPNNSICIGTKPVLSPRSSHDASTVTSALRSQPVISPKLLESIADERITAAAAASKQNDNNLPPTISPRTEKLHSYPFDASTSISNRSPFQNSTSQYKVRSSMRFVFSRTQSRVNCSKSKCFNYSSSCDDGPSTSAEHQVASAIFPPSPKHQNIAAVAAQNNVEMANKNDFGPIPISPHVNVPNTHAFNHHVAPPLPPRRRERKESDAVHLAQIRQAPDAPKLPPRDVSPPPLPPRLGLIHTTIKKTNASNNYNEDGLREHSLQAPNESSIMIRRQSQSKHDNEASACASKDGNGTAKTSQAIVQTSNSVDSSTSMSKPPDNSPIKKFRHNVTSAPPVNRKPSTNVSPTYSPGETTPRLPPKPRNPNFSSHNGSYLPLFSEIGEKK